MADKSGIEWTDATWNPVVGCSKVSPGCANCYAEALALRFGWTPLPWTPENAERNVLLKPERLEQPLRWQRPRRVFVNSMSDLFHELVPPDYIAKVYGVMRKAPQHTFQVLTKRPERARRWYHTHVWAHGLPNVWLGTSIENARHTWRADELRATQAAVRFISAEPLLGTLYPPEPELQVAVHTEAEGKVMQALLASPAARAEIDRSLHVRRPLSLEGIDWLIVGGESGGKASRPMHPRWATELRDACLEANLQRDPNGLAGAGPAFFFKQWGSWEPDTGAGGEGVFMGYDGRAVDRMALDAYPDSLREPVYRMRYAGVAPKSGGGVLEGRTWAEYPPEREAPGQLGLGQ